MVVAKILKQFKWILTLCVCLFHSVNAFNQPLSHESDTLNRFDENKKKTGWWIEYVDYRLMVTKKEKAVFYRFIWYENGLRIAQGYSVSCKLNLICNGNNLEIGKIVLLNGNYKYYTKKGWLMSEDNYENGKILNQKTYYSNGQLKEHIDYTQKFNNQFGSYKVTVYDKNGSVLFQYYWMKENGKWKWH